MNRLKIHSIVRFLCLALTLSWMSCQELDIDTQATGGKKISIDAQSEYNVLAAAPRAIIFNVSANTPWKIESDQNWCIPTPAMSAASALIAEITVNTEENTTELSRTATLTITAEGIDAPTVITVRQDSKGKLLIQPVEGSLSAAGGETPFTITSNKPWSITSDRIWLTFSKTSGTGTGEMETIQAIAESNEGARRTAVVTVTNGLEEHTFEVVQDGIVLEFEPVENPDTDYTFSAKGGTKTYRVVSNIEWKVTSENTEVVLNKLNETEFEVTISSNKYFTTQKPVILLLPADNSLTGIEATTMELKQGSNFWLDGSDAQYGDNGSITLTTTGNKCRLASNNAYKLGTYIWTFSNVEVTNAYFDLNAWPDAGNVNYHIFLGPAGGNKITNGGQTPSGADFWQAPATFDLTVEQLNAMRTLKVVLLPSEADANKLLFEVYLNDELLVSAPNRINPFGVDPSTPGMVYYFGFVSGNGTMTIDSFEVIPFE